jgi:hypothetical protein
MRLSLSLKILSIFYWWYLVVFVLSILPLLNIHIGYVPEFRGDTYVWDFELFFTAISVVWAVFLWRSSNNPFVNKTFILFTIWATIAHILAMVSVGIIKPAELTHLLLDVGAFVIPVFLVAWGYRKELMSVS